MRNLPVQVTLLDDVIVHKPQSADARGGQVEGCRGAEAAEADDEDACVGEAGLAGKAVELGEQELAGVARGGGGWGEECSCFGGRIG